MAIKVQFEIGHTAKLKSKKTQEGFTHDWELYVQGIDKADISQFVEKVVFNLHGSFKKPKRTYKEPPYAIKESGYAGFTFPIDIYFRNRDEPKFTFTYDLDLQQTGPPVHRSEIKKFIFDNPSEEFRQKLIRGGGVTVMASGTVGDEKSRSDLLADNRSQLLSKPKLSSDPNKKHKTRPDDSKLSTFANLFGPPITKTTIPAKVSPDPKNKASPSLTTQQQAILPAKSSSGKDKQSPARSTPMANSGSVGGKEKGEKKEKHSKHSSPHKEKDSREMKKDDKHEKREEKKRDKNHSKERERSREKSSKRPPSPKRFSSPKRSSPTRSSSAASRGDEQIAQKSCKPAQEGSEKKSSSSSTSKKSKKEKKSHEKEKERDRKEKDRSDSKHRDERSSSFGLQTALTTTNQSNSSTKSSGSASRTTESKVSEKKEKESSAVVGKESKKSVESVKTDVNEKKSTEKDEKRHKHKKKDKNKDKETSKEHSSKDKKSKEKLGKHESSTSALSTKKDTGSPLTKQPKLSTQSNNSAPAAVPTLIQPAAAVIVPDLSDADSADSDNESSSRHTNPVSEKQIHHSDSSNSSFPDLLPSSAKQRSSKERITTTTPVPSVVAPPPPPVPVLIQSQQKSEKVEKKDRKSKTSEKTSTKTADKEDKKRRRNSTAVNNTFVEPPLKQPRKDSSSSSLKNGREKSQSPLLMPQAATPAPSALVTANNRNDLDELQTFPRPTLPATVTPAAPPSTNVALNVDYLTELQELHQKIMTLQDNTELQQVVELIAATGKYEITNKTFDFDLCKLDRNTVQRLQDFFATSVS